mmetsp:Transcript_31606/g.103014  ORF Transcript_31606/g.103014 Transcript_31606/m.103014 type:complete len:240 (-) Transcript_31606:196-915(-)
MRMPSQKAGDGGVLNGGGPPAPSGFFCPCDLLKLWLSRHFWNDSRSRQIVSVEYPKPSSAATASRRRRKNDLNPSNSSSSDLRSDHRFSKASLSVTSKRFIATKQSASSAFTPSASTSRQPPTASGTASGMFTIGRRPSKKAGFGPPLRIRSEEMIMSAKPKRLPPPCASLKASPVRHASKAFLSDQTVSDIMSASSSPRSAGSSSTRRKRVKKRKPSNSARRLLRFAQRCSNFGPLLS